MAPGETSQHNPRGDHMLQVSVAVAVLAGLAVPLRLLARWRSKASIATDDWFIVASLAPLFGMVASSKSLADAGLGIPMTELSHPQVHNILKTLMGSLITYTLTITLVKLSLVLLYRRIFDTANFRRLSLVVGAACVVWFIINLFLIIFQCRPMSAAFDPITLFSDRCIDFQAFSMGITASNLALDVIILAMPIYMILGLNITIRQKTWLGGIFAIGGLSCIAGIMRIVALNHIQRRDLSYSLTDEYTWSQVEPAAAIICACLVTYRPLLKDLRPGFAKLFSNLSLSRSKASSSRTDTWGEPNSLEDGYGKANDFGSHESGSLRDLSSKSLRGKMRAVDASAPQARRCAESLGKREPRGTAAERREGRNEVVTPRVEIY